MTREQFCSGQRLDGHRRGASQQGYQADEPIARSPRRAAGARRIQAVLQYGSSRPTLTLKHELPSVQQPRLGTLSRKSGDDLPV
jgi:hypothetical protein